MTMMGLQIVPESLERKKLTFQPFWVFLATIQTHLMEYYLTLLQSGPFLLQEVLTIFISDIPAGITNYVSYLMSFANPISLRNGIYYNCKHNRSLNARCRMYYNLISIQTITVLNPTDQLLIDTNYDGIYESESLNIHL
jgi:hypothetical protein